MARIEQDESNWPLVIIRFPATAPTDSEIDEHIEAQRAMLKRKERFVEITDARRATPISARQRKVFADWIKESSEESKKYCLGLTIVVPNPIVRGALQAVLWLVTPPMPVKVGATLEESAAHCREWLAQSGLPNHARADEYIAKLERFGAG